jgi:hypothetical protein
MESKIDSALTRLEGTGSLPRGAILNGVNTILSRHDLNGKIESLLDLLALLITGSSSDLIDFYRVFCAEEPSAPRDIKCCSRWYRKISRERKRLIKEQGEAIRDFSSRLIKMQSTIQTLAEAHLQNKPVTPTPKRELSLCTPETILSQVGSVEPRKNVVQTEKEVDALQFEISSLKEKCSIMRNDLNYALKQRLDMEKRLSETTTSLEQKNAECLALQAMVRDVRWRNSIKKDSSSIT